VLEIHKRTVKITNEPTTNSQSFTLNIRKKRNMTLRFPILCLSCLKAGVDRKPNIFHFHGTATAQSVWRLATGWRSGDRISVGAGFPAPVQTGSGAHPASCTMGTGFFPGVKWPGLSVDHPPPSSAEVKESVELYIYSSSGPSRVNFMYSISIYNTSHRLKCYTFGLWHSFNGFLTVHHSVDLNLSQT
jgi:hypothetical protein